MPHADRPTKIEYRTRFYLEVITFFIRMYRERAKTKKKKLCVVRMFLRLFSSKSSLERLFQKLQRNIVL